MKSLYLLGFALLLSLRVSAQDTPPTLTYEYLTMVTDDRKPDKVYLSHSAGWQEEIRIASGNRFDYSGLLKLVTEKEKEGYELYSNSFTTLASDITSPHNYFLMRRKLQTKPE